MKYTSVKYGLFLLLLSFSVVKSSIAQTQVEVIKTAYFEKFANYIKWPTDSPESSSNTFDIAIVGDDDFCKLVVSAFKQREIKNRTINVSCLEQLGNIESLEMMFLASNKVSELEKAIAFCSSKNILLITNSEGFARKGSHINFYITSEQTLHFEMNKHSLDRDNFKVDFLLLDFAKVVKK